MYSDDWRRASASHSLTHMLSISLFASVHLEGQQSSVLSGCSLTVLVNRSWILRGRPEMHTDALSTWNPLCQACLARWWCRKLSQSCPHPVFSPWSTSKVANSNSLFMKATLQSPQLSVLQQDILIRLRPALCCYKVIPSNDLIAPVASGSCTCLSTLLSCL